MVPTYKYVIGYLLRYKSQTMLSNHPYKLDMCVVGSLTPRNFPKIRHCPKGRGFK